MLINYLSRVLYPMSILRCIDPMDRFYLQNTEIVGMFFVFEILFNGLLVIVEE